jgi:SAM-dependent methyltransferase
VTERLDWGRIAESDCLELASAIGRIARDLADSIPPPRGMPFYAVDSLESDPYVLDRFAEHGIFRKYQHTLQLGGALGGEARYWAARLGCKVLSVDPHAGLVRAATRLSAQARFGTRTRFLTGALTALPLRERRFTHVWSLTGLTDLADPLPGLAEAHRVLRPGGILCLKIEGREDVERWSAAILAAGFVSLRKQAVRAAERGLSEMYAELRLGSLLAAGERSSLLLHLHREICRARLRRGTVTMLLSAERPGY